MDAWIALVGVLVGTILTVLTNIAVTRIQFLNSRALDERQWSEERYRNQIQDVKDTLGHYVDRMENYAEERKSLIVALNNPLLRPETVMDNLFMDTWRTASFANESAVVARNFGNKRLSEHFLEYEKAFNEIWLIRIGRGNNQNLAALEDDINRLFSEITSDLMDLRAKIARLNILPSQQLSVSNLPKIVDNQDSSSLS